MSTRLTAVVLSFLGVLTISCVGANPQTIPANDLLGQLAGDWVVDGFVIGGDGGLVSSFACGSVTVAPARDPAVSISVVCEDAGDYTLRLKHGSGDEASLVTVKSRYGISIEEFQLEYVDAGRLGSPFQDGKVWLGTRDQLVDNETLSVTAMMARIEGRNWRGWTIKGFPTEATKPGGEAVKKPYFKVDLTRRK